MVEITQIFYFMKNYLLFVVCLLHFNLVSGQTKQNLRLFGIEEIDSDNVLHLDSSKYFTFRKDKSISSLIMNYTCKNEGKVIDTVEFSPYSSKLCKFVSDDKKRFVVLWITNYEYYPYALAYYITGDSLFKMGNLNVLKPCSSCESFEFPIEDVGMKLSCKNIDIFFLKDVLYKEDDMEQKLYKPKSLQYQYNIHRKELKIIQPR